MTSEANSVRVAFGFLFPVLFVLVSRRTDKEVGTNEGVGTGHPKPGRGNALGSRTGKRDGTSLH